MRQSPGPSPMGQRDRRVGRRARFLLNLAFLGKDRRKVAHGADAHA